MNISSVHQSSLYSLRQAIGMVNLRNAMNQNAHTVNDLLRGIEEGNKKILENSVTPHKGSSIDITL